MKMNFFLTISYMMLINSIIMSMSSNNWFFMWISLELNLMAFLSFSNKMNNNLSNLMMKYFIIQSLSSMLFFLSLILKNYFNYIELFKMFTVLSMFIKMGLFPFHSWMFEILNNINWNLWFLITSLQKIIPIIILMNLKYTNIMIIILLVMSLFISLLEMLNQKNIRIILSASSMSHWSWVILSIYTSNYNTFSMYMLLYLFIIFFFYLLIKINNWNALINNFNSLKSNDAYMFTWMILMFSGIPPFLMFIPKIFILMKIYNLLLLFILILSNFISSYIYLLLVTPSMLLKNIKNIKMKKYNNMFFYFNIFLFYFFLILM